MVLVSTVQVMLTVLENYNACEDHLRRRR